MKKQYAFLRICALFFMVGIFVWAVRLPQDVTIYNREPFCSIDSGWIQVMDDREVELSELQDVISCTVDEEIELKQVITEEMAGKCLVFYAEHQEVVVTIKDTEVYRLVCPKYLEIFGSPGRTWVNVYIPEEAAGEQMTLELRSNFSLFHGVPQQIYCLETNEVYSVQMDFLWLRNTTALVVLALAILSYINAVLWKQQKMRRYLFTMADLYLFVALWLCSEVNIVAIWSGRTFLSSVLSMIFVRVIPIVFYHFCLSLLEYTSWRTRFIGILVWGNFISSMFLQTVFSISLIRMLWIHMVVVALMCVLVLYEIYCHYRSRKKYHAYDGALYFIVVLAVAMLSECYIYAHYLEYRKWLGVPLTLACVAYALLSHLFLVHEESETNLRKQQLECEYHNLHKMPLNQQINAHFLYNSLNTISAYCKQDPELADKTVLLVAQYMRSYTHLIGECEYVTLAEELELIQYYMDIQNMRFENSIIFQVESNYEDAMLPPLTLQPLVENAVNHGLRNKRYHGTILIETRYIRNMVEISVSDNGIGFDTTNLQNTKGVGLKNLESRILAMGGYMIVKSEENKGTTVTLSVPVNEMKEELQL